MTSVVFNLKFIDHSDDLQIFVDMLANKFVFGAKVVRNVFKYTLFQIIQDDVRNKPGFHKSYCWF